ncbi:MAG TPA: hypothetical protein VJB91_01150 [Patescibacteria group bacterium]|nr:hypothetical protein [Patescibacteria group bacterium]
MPQTVSPEEYKKLLTDMIQKQIIILGPDIALLKARNVEEVEIDQHGKVTEIHGDPKQALQKLIKSYMELSGLIVQKTMEPLLQKYPTLLPTEGEGPQGGIQ